MVAGLRSTADVTDILIGGVWRSTSRSFEVLDPHHHEVIARVAEATRGDVDSSIERALEAFATVRDLPAHARTDVLARVAQGMRQDREGFARTLSQETGKPIREARVETDRAALIFAVAAEEARRIPSEVVNLDWAPAGDNRLGIYARFPIGVVLGITPWNYPLSLVAHKIAPAIAAGNTMVLKPASKTPLSALRIAQLVDNAGWPAGALSVIPSSAETIEPFVSDPRVSAVSFTGSMDVGWRLKKLAWRKKVALELGGNAGVVVHEDADVEYALDRIVAGAFGFSGQSCISVQRVYVHESIWDAVCEGLGWRIARLKLGDPADEATDIGPLISVEAAERVETWLHEAVGAGAEILIGGRRLGQSFEPTVVVNASSESDISACEVFAPLITLAPYRDFAAAIAAVDASLYGLQAGVFTRDIDRVWYAFRHLQVGALMVNEVPSYRLDHMPYGGVKDSGWGREGLRYAIEEFTEPRFLVLRTG